MAARIRTFAWAATPLGAIEGWPSSLKVAVQLMLACNGPTHLCVGDGRTHLYNDGYAALIGARHPAALGGDLRGLPAEADVVGMLASVFGGETVTRSDRPCPVVRRGVTEPAWFDLTGLPVRDETGAVFAMLVLHRETTAGVLAGLRRAAVEARLALLLKLGHARHPAAGAAAILDETCRLLGEWLGAEGACPVEADGAAGVAGAGRDVGAAAPSRGPPPDRGAAKALRESEERFRQFTDASSAALWIRDAASLTMEYASPAIEPIYGTPLGAILGEPRHWGAHIVPEDRALAFASLKLASGGEAVVHEFRILRPSDGAFRWVRNTDFPLRDALGDITRIGGIAEDVTEAKQSAEHQRVLMLELQHRVRNILAMIRSIADRTGDTADSVEDYRARLEGRLQALARTQTLLTRAANAGVDLATLIRAEVEAQAEEGQYVIDGPVLCLSPKAAEVLTLAVHELTTNALKYGALSHAGDRLDVGWTLVHPEAEPWLRLDWVETGAAAPLAPALRTGFGTSLIEQRIHYELQGRGKLTLRPEGMRCRLEFPVTRGDSILQTDAVTLGTTIAGGSLDMTGEADLSGCTVLVVEDDYFLAKDTERVLRRAGGEVLGPVGHEDQALALIAEAAPRCAIIDINLGRGAEFGVAEALQDRGVPFAFVTGYDDAVIPARFDGVERLRKPVEFRQVVRAVARLCAL